MLVASRSVNIKQVMRRREREREEKMKERRGKERRAKEKEERARHVVRRFPSFLASVPFASRTQAQTAAPTAAVDSDASAAER